MKSSNVSVLAVFVLAVSGLFVQASASAATSKWGFPSSQPFDAHGTKKPNVGTWLATYTVGGNQVDKIYVQWHRDGTASQATSHSPINGNVMLGDWKTAQDGTVSSSFAGWRFDNSGTLSGSLSKTETISIDGDTYSGNFDLKFFDLNGNLVNEVTGDLTATRTSP